MRKKPSIVKSLFTIMAFLAFSLPVIAQESESEKSNIIFGYDYVDTGLRNLKGVKVFYLRFPVLTTSKQISNPRLCLSKSHLKKLIKFLEKNNSTIKKWKDTATKEGVRGYEKKFDDSMPYDRIYYTYETKNWYNENVQNQMGYYSDRIYVSFYVNENGKSVLILKAPIGEKKISDGGTTIESTTTANTGAFGTKQVIGQSVTKHYKKADCGDFFLLFPVEKLDDFINQLKTAYKGFESNETVDKLFK